MLKLNNFKKPIQVFIILIFLLFHLNIVNAKGFMPSSGVSTIPNTALTLPTVQDPAYSRYSTPNWWSSFRNLRVKNILTVWIDRNNHNFVTKRCTLRVNLTLTGQKFQPGIQNTVAFNLNNVTVDLIFDTAQLAKETDKVSLVYENLVSSQWQVNSVSVLPTGTYGTPTVPTLKIENTIDIERIEQFGYDQIPYSNCAVQIVTGKKAFVKPYIRFGWGLLSFPTNTINSFEAFDIEYVHLDWNPSTGNSSGFGYILNNYPVDFVHNATRIRVTADSLAVPNVWDSGYVIFRVRPIGRSLSNPDLWLEGEWTLPDFYNYNLTITNSIPAITIGDKLLNHCLIGTNCFFPTFNWVYSANYAENGKISYSLAYFDGTLRNRESIGHSNENNIELVSQSIYDAMGREALVASPSPAIDSLWLHFRPKFNRNSTGQAYTFKDFDQNYTNSKQLAVSPMGTQSGANRYFSSAGSVNVQNNPTFNWNTKRMQNFVPDAEGWAFSQTEFAPDGTGRPLRSGGIGKQHQLSAYVGGTLQQRHEVWTWDGKPFQEELDALFGNEVGYAEKYNKVMSKDPNGQLSIAYIDPFGRTIATCLAGDPANSPSMMAINSSSHYLDYQVTIPESRQDNDQLMRIVEQNFVVTLKDTWRFEYSLPVKSIQMPCDEALCFNCGYELSIEILGIPSDTIYGPYHQFVGSFDTSNLTCQTPSVFRLQPNPLKLVLEPGEYKIIKKLRLMRERMDQYRSAYLEKANCIKPFYSFFDDELKKQGSSCPITCDKVQAEIVKLILKIDTLKGIAIANQLDTNTFAEFQATKEALEEMREISNDVCIQKSPCEALYTVMLSDVTPGGQYAKYEIYNEDGEVTTAHSLVNTGLLLENDNPNVWTCTIGSNSYKKNWRNPGDPSGTVHLYHNEDGTESLIPVVDEKPALISGKHYVLKGGLLYARPQDLASVEDFIANWQESWAKDIVYHHPEYCYYKACKNIEPSYAYDNMLMSESSAASAKLLGFYNPLRMTSLGSITVGSTTTALNYSAAEQAPLADPITALPYYTAHGSNFRNLLSSVILKVKNTSTGACDDMAAQTIWEIYEKQRLSKGLSLNSNDCADDAFWPLFRALYLQAKHKWLYTYYTTDSCPNGGACKGNVPTSLLGDRRFFQAQSGMNFNSSTDPDIIDPTLWSDLDNVICDNDAINAKIGTQMGKQCESECRLRAKEWLFTLKDCPAILAMSPGQLQTAEDAMTNMCTAGCDFQNPYGSVNVSPANLSNTTYPYKNIRDLLIGLNILDPNNENTLCSDLNISFPGEYGHDYNADLNPANDTCACNKIKDVHKHTKKCPLQDTANVAQDCGCDIQNRELRNTVVGLHGVKETEKCKNCLSCDDLEKPVADFIALYESQCTTSTDTSLWQQYLGNYLNRKFGFNLEYSDYKTFATQCLDTTLPSTAHWFELWQWVGTERLVSWNYQYQPWFQNPAELKSQNDYKLLEENKKQYHENIAGLNSPKLELTGNNITNFKQPESNWITSTDNVNFAAPFKAMTIDYESDVKCRCEKVLEIERLITEGKHINPTTNIAKSPSQLSIEIYGVDIYCSGNPADAKSMCCKIWRKDMSPCDPAATPAFKSGDRFGMDQQSFFQEYNFEITQAFTTLLGAWEDCQTPCVENSLIIDNSDGLLDHCACDSLKKWNTAWAASSHANTMTLEEYILKIRKFTVASASELLSKCTEVFKHGLLKKNGNTIGNWTYGDDWNQVSLENLEQEADYGQLKVPNYIKCTPSSSGNTGGKTYTYKPCNCCPNVMPCDEMELLIADYVQNNLTSTSKFFFENDPYYLAQLNLNQPGMKYPYTSTAINMLLKNSVDSSLSWRKDMLKGLFDLLKSKIYPCWPSTPDPETSSISWDRLLNKILKNMRSCYDPQFVDEDKCNGCYKANGPWLEAYKTYVNKIIHKDWPNYLHQTDWYFKSSNTNFDIPEFYNSSVLYPNTPHPQKLFYSVDPTTYGQRHMQVTVTDSLGFQLIYAMELLDDRPWVYWGKLRNITKIIPIKSVNCENPWQFYLEATLEIPPYKWSDFNDCPNAGFNGSANTRCEQKTTILVRLLKGGNMATSVPCLKCVQLCNQPYQKPSFVEDIGCQTADYTLAMHNALDAYGKYMNAQEKLFDSLYIDQCHYKTVDTTRGYFSNRQYHYTLYYYDQAGNLCKTIPPAGVDIDNESMSQTDRQKLVNDRINKARNHRLLGTNTRAVAYHGLITQYKYNTINHAIWQQTPDGGVSKSWLDNLGRIAISQSSNQAINGKYSYTLYDDLGRAIEGGQINPLSGTPTPADVANPTWLDNFLNIGSQYSRKTELAYTTFDQSVNPTRTGAAFAAVGGQQNLRNRIAGMYFEEINDGDPGTYNNATLYTYDIHGNAHRVVQDIRELDLFNAPFYTIDYQYDLLSGNVNRVSYNNGKPDRFYHKYQYDLDNKLSKVYTSMDSTNWENDARYYYYLHNSMGRTELGELNVQGLDFSHTIEGWIKVVNGSHIDSSADMGWDGMIPAAGTAANKHQDVARDAFAYTLNYYAGDYAAINGATLQVANLAGSGPQQNFYDLYNGNIAQMNTSLPQVAALNGRIIRNQTLGNVYRYDQLNRLKQHRVFEDINTTPSAAAWKISSNTGMGRWYEEFNYDPNGNITSLKRNGNNVGLPSMDDLTYNYSFTAMNVAGMASWQQLDNNKLNHVNDAIAPSNYAQDIDDEGSINILGNNYTYDNLGNLIKDNSEQIEKIDWTVSGKIKKITRKNGSTKPDLEFMYDAADHRICKITKPRIGGNASNETKWTRQYYVMDASGHTMTTYQTQTNSYNFNTQAMTKRYLQDFAIFGSKREGLLKVDTILDSVVINYSGIETTTGRYASWSRSSYTPVLQWNSTQRNLIRGQRQFELSNHLGNVLVTIQDRKLALRTITISGKDTIQNYQPYIITITDYYAFGSSMEGRSFAYGSKCRYGFNSQEKETELGDYYSFEYRVHDARLGRFLSVDPIENEYPWNSTYSFAENQVIWAIDLEGKEATIVIKNSWFYAYWKSAFVSGNYKLAEKIAMQAVLEGQATWERDYSKEGGLEVFYQRDLGKGSYIKTIVGWNYDRRIRQLPQHSVWVAPNSKPAKIANPKYPSVTYPTREVSTNSEPVEDPHWSTRIYNTIANTPGDEGEMPAWMQSTTKAVGKTVYNMHPYVFGKNIGEWTGWWGDGKHDLDGAQVTGWDVIDGIPMSKAFKPLAFFGQQINYLHKTTKYTGIFFKIGKTDAQLLHGAQKATNWTIISLKGNASKIPNLFRLDFGQIPKKAGLEALHLHARITINGVQYGSAGRHIYLHPNVYYLGLPAISLIQKVNAN